MSAGMQRDVSPRAPISPEVIETSRGLVSNRWNPVTFWIPGRLGHSNVLVDVERICPSCFGGTIPIVVQLDLKEPVSEFLPSCLYKLLLLCCPSAV